MQIIRNLSEEQLTELLLKSDERYVRRVFGAMADSAREAAEQPDAFWQQQQVQIRSRISAREKFSSRMTMTLATAVALILMAGFGLRTDSRVVAPQADPDQDLLISVERTVGSEVPAALEPASLLADEIVNQSQLRSASQRRRKGEHQ